MSAPRVSVLMTVFNTGGFVKDAVDSVLSQTLTDFELIVVDDCSSDDSWSIVEQSAAADSRIVAIRRGERGGASAGLNEGLRRATGQYIVRQDGDDLSTPTRLAEQVAFLEANPHIGAVGTQAVLIDPAGARIGLTTLPETDAEIQPALVDQMCFIGPAMMVRRSAFERAGFSFDESLSGSEDYDLCLRLAEVAGLANMPEALYLYRQHPSSVSHSQRPMQLFRKAVALENAVHRRFGAAPPAEALRNVARDYVRAAVVGHAMNEAGGHQDCLARALALCPGFFRNIDIVEQVVRKYTPRTSVDAALQFTSSLFRDVLPRTRRLGWLKRRLVAELHVREVFGSRDSRTIVQHLLAAVRANPVWLMNPGVLSLFVRHSKAALV
jgi:glycosyltransferase involved in cell wall biosynthesis